MGGVLEQLREAIDAVADAELADSESVIALHRELARLDAVTTENTGRWEAAREWAADGARSAAAWLAARCHLPQPSARRRIRLARALRVLPVAAAAWKAGKIQAVHVASLAAARNDRTAALLARDEALLVDQATTLPFSIFRRTLDYWLQHADPDGTDDQGRRQVDDRRLDVSTTFQDMVVGDFVLDPVNGTIVKDTIDRIERELFEADWAEAREQLGRDPLAHELARTPKQRRADALVEMAVRARTAPRDGRRPAPLFSVFVGYETFAGRICELANGTVVTPGTLVPYLDEAYLERVVFDGPSRVIDVGETRRFYTGAKRRSIELRDRECFEDTCEERTNLQVDHIIPASEGGPTTQTNGRLACGFHNRWRHRGPPRR